ncbi:hypothetical protein ONE63_000171 [Megalurothrips usitatus]|uniref:Ketosynthase family 3 (KS3) domain-containing protein n=1 Tax=Megalurothrips usitatus TaxID=439358 RepID=A0AAV7Y4S4_9NEOP|nr:hypothetical protein ONE63_000171 [Megalurothrips usitatus]
MPGIGVVISGIGGSFPQSSNVQDFGRDLLENKYLPTPTERWRYVKIDAVCGQIPYQNFDDTFFGISKRLAKSTDPATKMGYVRCFEAIVDAGVHPQKMRGGNVGVYSSGGISEFEQLVLFNERHDGYVVMGYARAMLPNRISYIFDFKGPSCSMDSSWAGSHLALRTAADSIRSGACEAALVVGSYIGRFPEASALLRQLGFISDDGLTRSFDLRASGSVHSDCCVAFFLQRADQAKRCYAHLLAADFAYVGRGSNVDITLPSPRGIRDFITGMYRTHGIDPKRVAYLEADGSAHPVRDECELDAIDAALVKDCGRCVPLLVGSVRSNLGHADSVNGHAAICKAICAMESGVVPATLNHSEANTRVAGLVAGRLRVVDENTPLALTADSVVAVNTLGLSGSVGHSVLQANPRGPTSPQDPDEHLPRLVTLAATNEDTVQEAARRVQAAPFDTNFYRLVQDVFSPNISGFNYRSYVICPPSEGDSFPVEKAGPRPVWFVYSGMGSQWPGMGADLMRIPIFADTIERLHAALEDKGLDLKAILTDTGPEAFDNILKSFVGVTACQVALTNVLAAVGVVPDGFIGHSVGELGCAFADGCLSETEAILAAWARGVASNRSPLIKGMMAAIGLGYRDVLPRLPAAIDIACHNSAHSCTLSGPAADVRRFTDQLLAEGVFAKAVSVADIAYHSRYIQPAGPLLRQYLQQVTPKPKLRSPKWVSSSVPAELRGTDADRFCSADYQTNNLLGPVLFEEGLASIPRDALVIEIGPHGLLQPLLRRALREQVNVALTLRSSSDSVRFLLNAIGKISLYTSVPDVAALYPDVEFPVPRGTHSLASLLQWSIEPHDDMYSTMCRRDLGLEVHNDSPSMKAHGTRLLPLSEQLVRSDTAKDMFCRVRETL